MHDASAVVASRGGHSQHSDAGCICDFVREMHYSVSQSVDDGRMNEWMDGGMEQHNECICYCSCRHLPGNQHL